MTATDALQWEIPGPGGWRHDAAHSAGPTSQIVQDLFPSAMADGFRSFTGRYGLLLSHIEIRYVHGYAYGGVRIAGVAPSDRRPPPPAVLRILSRVHPEMRRRDRAARRALAQRTWDDDLRRWFDELRPARVAALRTLQAVSPDELDDDALAVHVEACAAALADGLQEHFSLLGASSVPVGLYILREQERGRSAADAIADLAGAAERSTGASLPALRAISEALALAGIEPTTLDEVRSASPEAREALDAFLDEHGQRVVGANDVTGRRLVELPDVILRSIAAAGARQSATPAAADAVDQVEAEARLAIASRDDHSGIGGSWSVGLLRRALLAVAHRLEERGLDLGPEAVFACSLPEVAALLTGAVEAPTAEELAARVEERRRASAATPPEVLGEDHPPPDPALFAEGLRTMAAAMATFLGTLDADRSLRGTGIGTERHRGRAIVATTADDAIARLRPGDVLVTPMTTPSFNCILPIAGGLVTVHGGPMSHAGIVARELGIPAVVGLADACERIADGAEVEVDPVAGTVSVITG
jgi:phosphohistidine swiveling domain-containing protein